MEQIVLKNTEFCFICKKYMSSCRNKLVSRLGHSNVSLFSLIESFIEQPLSEELLSIGAAVCQSCMVRINEYDQLTTRAAQLKNELIRTFRTSEESSGLDILQSELHFFHRIPETELQGFNETSVETSQSDEVSDDFRRMMEDEGIVYENVIIEDENAETDKQIKCVQCNLRNCIECFSWDLCEVNGFQNHIAFHNLKSSGKNRFDCETCNVSFKSMDSLKVHLSSNHGSIRNNIPCPFDSCEKSFTNKLTLKTHLICHNRHEKAPSFICDICGKGFHYKLSFTQHQKIHSGIKDKECESCGFKAISSAHLKRHIRARHTKEKNHVCGYCSKAFSERYNMTSHIKKQHLEKP